MIDFVENKFVLNLMITSLASGITAIFFFSIHSLLQRQQLSSEVSVVGNCSMEIDGNFVSLFALCIAD